jgi:predicted nucleic acid-binding protein
MSDVDFLDTNVLICFLDPSEPHKHKTATSLVSQKLMTHSAVISYQVVQETLHVIGRKFAEQFDARRQQLLLDELLLPLMKVLPSAGLYREALRIKDRYGFSLYDALIIASALHAGCKRLLSEDLQHGQVIDGLKIVNPFAA